MADPENIRVAKDLLGHRSFSMTEKHYIDGAQARIAGRELAALLAERGRLQAALQPISEPAHID
jgi:integrase